MLGHLDSSLGSRSPVAMNTVLQRGGEERREEGKKRLKFTPEVQSTHPALAVCASYAGTVSQGSRSQPPPELSLGLIHTLGTDGQKRWYT